MCHSYDVCKEMSDAEVVKLATRVLDQVDEFGETILTVMVRTGRLQLCKKTSRHRALAGLFHRGW